jgi:hypothetical protein
MKHEIIWHGPTGDVSYMVEADDEEHAMERLCIYLNDPDDNGGINLKGETGMKNDLQDMKAILDKAGINYSENEGDLPDGNDTATLVLPGTSGIYFTFIIVDDDNDVAWKLTEYGSKYSVNGDAIVASLPDDATILRNVVASGKRNQ